MPKSSLHSPYRNCHRHTLERYDKYYMPSSMIQVTVNYSIEMFMEEVHTPSAGLQALAPPIITNKCLMSYGYGMLL